ncbi:MAG TPA: hypothetical protein VJ803_02525 [Gemmatimonadaceae bacterium]|nr:hypothetical protein [Gemmatimonadaceae bacterium]
MAYRPRSLKHEYELFVEREIESYKEAVPRSKLLSIGDQAVAALAANQQLALTEMLLCEEVDRIIRDRVKIPKYDSWCRRRRKELQLHRQPERCGIHPMGALVRGMPKMANGHVLVVGASEEGRVLYLAAHGCAVTAVDATEEPAERLMDTIVGMGLTGQVRCLVGELKYWTPDVPLKGVYCRAHDFARLTRGERRSLIEQLGEATAAGGLHLVAAGPGEEQHALLNELRRSYKGWRVSLSVEVTSEEVLWAEKSVA